MALSRTG